MELPELPINKDLTYLGLSTYRDKNTLFGIKRHDRRQHVYMLGKSGTGKSALMFNMIVQNIRNGEGVCVVDPHGELVEGVLSAIPRERIKDVIYFNPADKDHHIGFNVLELRDLDDKNLVASGLMGIFTKIWANAWSSRMEHILSNTILALLEVPGSTMLGISRMLVDKDYRQKVIATLKDPVIKTFWVHEYEAWQEKFRNEAIAPIQNKVGQFLSTALIRNVVGQSKSTINIFDIMNEGKIFLVNVSKGRIGEDNSGLLGGMIITKIQLAAMERVRIPEEERRDFYLYVDEFQNFVTEAFSGILSEARKYRLNLTIAHQYTAQLVKEKSSNMRDAIFGNVGTIISFRVGPEDAKFLEKEFDPEFTPQDIVNLPNFKIYLKLMIDGITSRPFSAKTLPPLIKYRDPKFEAEIIESSRKLYCRPSKEIEQEINSWSGMSLGGGAGSFEKITTDSPRARREKSEESKNHFNDPLFFEPLSLLGIEFPSTPEARPMGYGDSISIVSESINQRAKPGMFNAIRRALNKKPKPPRTYSENPALRDVLKKNLPVSEISRPIPEPVSLDVLENTPDSAVSVPTLKNQGASPEDMRQLEDLVSTASVKQEEAEEEKQKKIEDPAQSSDESLNKNKVREVPEEVLRKILE